jgi:putative oxidoreductase
MATAVRVNTAWDDIGKLLLRVTVAILIGFHGVSKMQRGIGWMAGVLQSHHLPVWLGYGVYVAEIVAPILLILGVLTRPSALVIAFDMCMAIYLVQQNRIFTTNQGGGWAIELEMFYLLAAVAIFFLGSGRFAVSRGYSRWG